jgi:Ca2+-binding RTX toxin-like protein
LTLHPKKPGIVYTTNDLPGCPNKGGLLSGTDDPDQLGGKDGDDDIRGLGAEDYIYGGSGDDVIHGGPGDDSLLYGGEGEDVLYGGDGDDELTDGGGKDVIFCPERDVVEGCASLGDRRVDIESYRPSTADDDDRVTYGEPDSADVIYGGDGNDFIEGYQDGQPDKFYCGKGKDVYVVHGKSNYVDSSCEKRVLYKGIP